MFQTTNQLVILNFLTKLAANFPGPWKLVWCKNAQKYVFSWPMGRNIWLASLQMWHSECGVFSVRSWKSKRVPSSGVLLQKQIGHPKNLSLDFLPHQLGLHPLGPRTFSSPLSPFSLATQFIGPRRVVRCCDRLHQKSLRQKWEYLPQTSIHVIYMDPQSTRKKIWKRQVWGCEIIIAFCSYFYE